MTTTLAFTVIGTPAPQGSKRHVGNGRLIESSRTLPAWRDSVTWHARQAITADWTPATGAEATIVFYFARPKHHYRTGKNAHLLRDNAPTAPTVKPDLDKLTRAIFDALTDARAVTDDSVITALMTRKRYAEPTGAPGVTVTLQRTDRP